MISTKTKYIRTDGWRGYEQPINAVAGANDTGEASDSPCPSTVCERELSGFKKLLRKNGIKFKTTVNRSSNVFCVHRYVLVAPEDREKALELADQYREGTDNRLFYTCRN